MIWNPYKNGQGARREDGLYLRRAWNWYPAGKRERGWDLNREMTLIGTFPDQPLVVVQSKVDALLPPPVAKHPFLHIFRWCLCPNCRKDSVVEGSAEFLWVIIRCCHCGHLWRGFTHDTVRELERYPGQHLSTFKEG